MCGVVVRVGQKLRVPFGQKHGGRWGHIKSVHLSLVVIDVGGYDYDLPGQAFLCPSLLQPEVIESRP